MCCNIVSTSVRRSFEDVDHHCHAWPEQDVRNIATVLELSVTTKIDSWTFAQGKTYYIEWPKMVELARLCASQGGRYVSIWVYIALSYITISYFPRF